MKNWYDRVKRDLIATSTRLRSSDLTDKERKDLYEEQTALIIELDEIYDDLIRLAK